MKKWILVFILAFGLNLIWENLHSLLYIHYKQGPITEFVLVRAALSDALIILGMIFFLSLIPTLSRWPWLIIVVGIIIAVGIEWWALGAGRWAYKDIMPIIPFLDIGLTPTIQLGLLGYIAYKLGFKNP